MRGTAWCGLALGLTMVSPAGAGTTAKIGGPGGTSTVTMDCGSSAFMVGLAAVGGRDHSWAPNLVRRLRFTCRPYSGTTPGAATSQTREAAASVQVLLNLSQSSEQCPQEAVLDGLEVLAGQFIDRITKISCRTSRWSESTHYVNVGGDGGSRAFVECPSGEGLYKIEARVGSAIDSLKGTCRAFGDTAAQPLAIQISNTLSPKPTHSSPVKVLPASAKSFSFEIEGAPDERIGIGITSETDLLGGGAANPPEFRLEVLNPAGSVVASRTVSKPPAASVQGLNVTIHRAGTWKLRVTNLKKSYGALDVKAIYAGATF